MSILDTIDGTMVDGKIVRLLPPEIIAMNTEIMLNHPELVPLLNANLTNENHEPDIFYGTVAAYCGIELNGSYGQQYLIEQLSRALVRKRTVAVTLAGGSEDQLGINTMPSFKNPLDNK
jgi:hypothetical protein